MPAVASFARLVKNKGDAILRATIEERLLEERSQLASNRRKEQEYGRRADQNERTIELLEGLVGAAPSITISGVGHLPMVGANGSGKVIPGGPTDREIRKQALIEFLGANPGRSPKQSADALSARLGQDVRSYLVNDLLRREDEFEKVPGEFGKWRLKPQAIKVAEAAGKVVAEWIAMIRGDDKQD